MATLTDHIVDSLRLSCNCDFTKRYITNSRWVCDRTMPTRVIFEADVIGTGNIDSVTIAFDIIGWADSTDAVDLGTGTALGLEGGEVSTEGLTPTTPPVTSTIQSSATPPLPVFVWIIGIIAGVIVALILIAVIVVILLWWKRSNDTKNAKLVEGTIVCQYIYVTLPVLFLPFWN